MRRFTTRWFFAAFLATPLLAANLQPSDNDPFFQYERLRSPSTAAPGTGRWTFQKTASRPAATLLLSGPYLFSQPGIAPEGHKWKALPHASRTDDKSAPAQKRSAASKPLPAAGTLQFDQQLPIIDSALRARTPGRTE